MYDYLKGKKVKITSGGTAGGKINWDDRTEDKGIDHHLEKVKQDAEIFSSGSDDMSSDDTDFNPDALEALSAKEEYDSEPSTTSSEDVSDDYGSGPDADRKRAEKRKQKAEKKAERDKKKEKKAGEPSEKKPKKKKMTKLPGQPKKNQSAYFLWMNENREKIKKDNPGLSMTDMTKKAGEIWREMNDKSKWNEKAEVDKKRYEKEMEKWKAEGGDEALKAAKKQSKKEKRAAIASESTENKLKTSAKNSSIGTGSHFKSKEYIESTDESSS